MKGLLHGTYSTKVDKTFTSQYMNVLIYAVSRGFRVPTYNNQVKQNILLRTLLYNGVLNNLDSFYNFYTNGDSDFAKIDQKNPGSNNADGTATFLPFTGYSGDGISTYLDFGQVLNTVGLKYQINDACIGADITAHTLSAPGAIIFGALNTAVTAASQYYHDTSNKIGWSINNLSGSFYPSDAVTGNILLQRSGTGIYFVKNGVQLTAKIESSVGVPQRRLSLFARTQNSPAHNVFSQSTATMAFHGQYITKYAEFNAAWQNYKSNPT